MLEANTLINQVVTKRISISEVSDYADVSARLGEDIFRENGVILLPKGTEISSLLKFSNDIETVLKKWGVYTLLIELHSQIDAHEIEHIIRASEEFIGIDSKFARETVEQVEDVYSRISEGNCGINDINRLVDSGKTLTKIAVEAPEIMFCLGHVRGSDEYTYVHSLNVSLLSTYVANRMFPDDKELSECMSIAGVLHDLGKAQIPKEILNKPGRLTDEEFTIMKKHAVFGEEIAKKFGVTDSRILSVIRGHHEKFSGEGYPDGLSKDKLPIETRIAAVADVFDALTARRVYKEPMESRKAIGIMVDDSRLHFDPDVLRILLLSIGIYPPGTMVELSDTSIGVVVGNSGDDLVRPQVMIKIDSFGRPIKDLKILNLRVSAPLHIKRSIQNIDKFAF